MFAIKKLHIKL